MPWVTRLKMTPDMERRCCNLVYKTAQKYHIAPILITAHVRHLAADEARKEVQRIMLTRMHMRRWEVARLFNRDLRRVRKSVLGV